jgi:hypothetical protein
MFYVRLAQAFQPGRGDALGKPNERACISAGSAAISAATVSFRISTCQGTGHYISILR